MKQTIICGAAALGIVFGTNGCCGKVQPQKDTSMESEDKLSFVETSESCDYKKQPGDYVILVKGNSISRHGMNQNTIRDLGWDRVCGMAAGSEQRDYVHLFAAMVQKSLPEKKVRLFFGKGGKPALSLQTVEQEKSLIPDLIIVQNGEHSASASEIGNFKRDHLFLLKTLCELENRPVVISIGIWNPRCREEFTQCTGKNYFQYASEILDFQRKTAIALGIGFADVSKYENDPANTGTGKVAGVRWHPNDSGMRCYAKELFAVFQSSIKTQ